MKAITLNKASLAVIHAASEDEYRQNLNGVHITPKYAEASNGHWLARITHPEQPEAAHEPFTGVVPLGTITEANKALPKPGKRGPTPTVTVNTTAEGCAWETGNVTGHFQVTETEFPDVTSVVPTSPVAAEVSLNAQLLKDICTAAAQFYGNQKLHGLTLRIRSNKDPVEIISYESNPDGQELYALLMPLKPHEVA